MNANMLLRRARANLNQGNKFKTLGEIDESIQSYRRAVEIKPDFVKPLYELAKIYESQDDLSQAIKCYWRIIGLNPDDYDTYLKLAKVLQKQNKVYGAIAAYQEAIELKLDLNLRVYIKLCNLILQ